MKFIEKYEDHWDWELLSGNTSIPFTIELIDRFENRWDFDSFEWNSKITSDAELRNYLNICHNTDAYFRVHHCPYCYRGEEILEQLGDSITTTDFCFCPNFNWTTEFASKFYKRVRTKEDIELLVSHISFTLFDHWSIDLLEAFENYWEYIIIEHSKELMDYLCSIIKQKNALDRIINNFQ